MAPQRSPVATLVAANLGLFIGMAAGVVNLARLVRESPIRWRRRWPRSRIEPWPGSADTYARYAPHSSAHR
ncbi:hypothetical protein VST63_06090 [Mycolicibacterium sp. 050232]|uniref:hypothetical protein n=1 Tax=Mycolicibacterium sp. 050232 TaxID=3113982 RepID=UPI002E29AA32|nr:hypothetical protein [Mycolicibacterium sp. 050232]MED5811925.1 hypothetical protein [Mycolicibacterium sp. 050232]